MDMEYALLFMLHGWLERTPCLLRHTKFLNRMYLDDGTLDAVRKDVSLRKMLGKIADLVEYVGISVLG
ncbi:hypothetical protein [Bifidobacterium callitrichos]|uniref:hypothetical protein n=1 Tax=Bifidobacterium callitrichos TaxID=762209 RepID=UPI001269BA3C|nr:hypothetical protein [Bifidobacterium callitrichos]